MASKYVYCQNFSMLCESCRDMSRNVLDFRQCSSADKNWKTGVAMMAWSFERRTCLRDVSSDFELTPIGLF